MNRDGATRRAHKKKVQKGGALSLRPPSSAVRGARGHSSIANSCNSTFTGESTLWCSDRLPHSWRIQTPALMDAVSPLGFCGPKGEIKQDLARTHGRGSGGKIKKIHSCVLNDVILLHIFMTAWSSSINSTRVLIIQWLFNARLLEK